MTQPPGSQPGWYPDPQDSSQSRWWDGIQWTGWTSQTSPSARIAPAKPGILGRAVNAAKMHPVRTMVIAVLAVGVVISAFSGEYTPSSPVASLPAEPTPSATISPSQSTQTSASSADFQTPEVVTWQDAYEQYITSLTGTPTFMLIDMGYTYPVLLVKQYSFGSDYSIVAFGGDKVYEIDRVGSFPDHIQYGDGFIYHWSMGASIYYRGYVIANVVDCLQNGVKSPACNRLSYSYNLFADEGGTFNSLDSSMSDADAEAQLNELEVRAKALTTPFNYSSDVENQIDNTDLNYIRTWS